MLAVSGCGSGSTTECLSSGAGEVCAVSDDGSITFTGSGLEAGSQVSVSTAEIEDSVSTFEVDSEGMLTMQNGAIGFVSVFADAEFNFTVSALDEDGEAIEGEIVIVT